MTTPEFLVTRDRNPGSSSDSNPWLLLYCIVAFMTKDDTSLSGSPHRSLSCVALCFSPLLEIPLSSTQGWASDHQATCCWLESSLWRFWRSCSKAIRPYIKQARVKAPFPQSETHTTCAVIWFRDWIQDRQLTGLPCVLWGHSPWTEPLGILSN